MNVAAARLSLRVLWFMFDLTIELSAHSSFNAYTYRALSAVRESTALRGAQFQLIKNTHQPLLFHAKQPTITFSLSLIRYVN